MRRLSIAAVLLSLATAARAEIIPVPDAMIQDITDQGREAHRVRDYETALQYYRAAEELGSLPAHANIGILYFRGDGVPMDQFRGLSMMEGAARNGSPRIAYLLAQMLITPPQQSWVDPSDKAAADAGSEPKTFRLGDARKWMIHSARNGSIDAMITSSGLARTRTPRDPHDLFCWNPRRLHYSMKVIDAANSGDQKAARAVGMAYATGTCLIKDHFLAAAYLYLASSSGAKQRRLELARFLLRQTAAGAEGVDVLRELSQGGDPTVLAELSIALRTPSAAKPDYDLAAKLLLWSIEVGSPYGLRLRQDEPPGFIKALKTRMIAQGQYTGPIDGSLDLPLREALAAYPKDAEDLSFTSLDEDFGSRGLREAIDFHKALLAGTKNNKQLLQELRGVEVSALSLERMSEMLIENPNYQNLVDASLRHLNWEREKIGVPPLDLNRWSSQ